MRDGNRGRGEDEGGYKQGGSAAFWFVRHTGAILPRQPLVYWPMNSTIPGSEENYGPASPHHGDPGPTNTDLQGGLSPEGSSGVAALSPNIILGSNLPELATKKRGGKTARGAQLVRQNGSNKRN